MRLFVLSFLLGVSCILWMTKIPNLYLLSFILIVALSFYLKYKKTALLLGLSFILGFSYVSFVSYQHLKNQLPHHLEKKTIVVRGYITSLPKIHGRRSSFEFKTIQIEHKAQKRLFKLSWFNTMKELHPGDLWLLTVRLKRPHGFMNPGGFDYEAWLFERGISATGYVVRGNCLKSSWLHSPINRLRQLLIKQILQSSLQHEPLVEILIVMITGSRDFVSAQEWQVFRATGTNHLIAIAGLHVGLISGFVFFIINFLWCRSAFLTQRVPARIAAAYFSLLAGVFYSLLAGFSMQTQRAVIMLSVFLGALILRRQIIAWHAYILALFIILMINPLSVLSPSFWLSFGAVFFIIYCMHGRLQFNGLWWKWGRVQMVIMLGLLPLTLWFFHEVSFTGFVANIVAVPWFSFIIVPCSFVGTILLFINPTISHYILYFALKNIQFLWKFLVFISHYHYHLGLGLYSIWALLFTIIAVILLLTPRGFPGRYLSLIFLLPFITFHHSEPTYGSVKFTLFDVGQGLAALMQTQHHVLIYDTGPSFGPEFNAGDTVILPFLKNKGIHSVDTLVVSHGDNDHIGGSKALLKNMIVKKILTSVPGRFTRQAVFRCHQGQHWVWDGVVFTMLSPIGDSEYQGNDSSCVLHVKAGSKSILLPGDISRLVESTITKLKSSILIAPHHGSHTASSWRFIKKINPEYVLFSTGYLNRFHFPHPSVVNRYKKLHTRMLNTALTGAISFYLTGDNLLTPDLYRVTHQRVWR